MKTAKHPILNLTVNENGTKIIFEGKELQILTYKQPRQQYVRRQVNFASQTQGVAKLVCECWHGMREDMSQQVHRIDKNPDNDHYTNLYWGKRGKIRTSRTKRCKSSKIKKEEIPTICQRLKNGESLRNIAKSYNTSDMSIYRIKLRFITSKRLLLKAAVMRAKNKHQITTAFAKYFGFPSVREAISNLGIHQFKLKLTQIAVTL